MAGADPANRYDAGSARERSETRCCGLGGSRRLAATRRPRWPNSLRPVVSTRCKSFAPCGQAKRLESNECAIIDQCQMITMGTRLRRVGFRRIRLAIVDLTY